MSFYASAPAELEFAPSALSAVAMWVTAAIFGCISLGMLALATKLSGGGAAAVAVSASGLAVFGFAFARFGAAVRRGPTLRLWSDGTVAILGLFGWKIRRRSQIRGWKWVRTGARGLPTQFPQLFPHGWLTGLNLGEQVLPEQAREQVHAWIRRNYPEL